MASASVVWESKLFESIWIHISCVDLTNAKVFYQKTTYGEEYPFWKN